MHRWWYTRRSRRIYYAFLLGVYTARRFSAIIIVNYSRRPRYYVALLSLYDFFSSFIATPRSVHNCSFFIKYTYCTTPLLLKLGNEKTAPHCSQAYFYTYVYVYTLFHCSNYYNVTFLPFPYRAINKNILKFSIAHRLVYYIVSCPRICEPSSHIYPSIYIPSCMHHWRHSL